MTKEKQDQTRFEHTTLTPGALAGLPLNQLIELGFFLKTALA